MAVVTGNEYDHITIQSGSNQTVHYLKDTVARGDVSSLKSAIDTGMVKNTWTWQRGGLDGVTVTSQQYRAVTTDLLSANKKVIIKNTNPDYTFASVYTLNGTDVWTGWVSAQENNTIVIPEGSTYRIVVRKASENYRALTDDELIAATSAIFIDNTLYYKYFDIENNQSAANYGKSHFDTADFRIGVYYNNGSYYRDAARVCTKSKMQFQFDTRLIVNSGYRLGVIYYDSEGNPQPTNEWSNSDVTIPANTYFTLSIDNGNTSATANIDLYVSQVFYKTALGMEVDKANGIGKYYYSGVNIKPEQHGFYTEQLPWSYTSPTTAGTFTPQAMSYYGGVVFKCWKENLIQLYNAEDGTKIAEYAVTSDHGDCMSFSNEFYDSNDEFPLAYFTSDTNPLKVYVNRLTRSGSTLIRTLQFSIENAGYYAGHAVDAKNNRLITLGYTENSFETNPNNTNFMICSVWNLNNLTQNADDTYTPALIKTFTLPFIICTQDQCYYNNKFIVISSNWQNINTIIYVIDIGAESIVATLNDIPYNAYETEGIFWIGNDMYVNGNGITKYMFT